MENPDPKRYLIFFLLLVIRINTFACDTLYVVYSEKHRKFEIDTLNCKRCNQNVFANYAEFFKKLTIPRSLLDSNSYGKTYLYMKGNEIKILRGICSSFNQEIIDCYKKNNFYFECVFLVINIPPLDYELSLNKSYIDNEELYKKFSIAKTKKKMKVAVPDSNNFKEHLDFIKTLNLKDLTQTKDDIYIRIRVDSTLSTIYEIANIALEHIYIYEFKLNRNDWKARRIRFSKSNFRYFYFSFNVFRNNHSVYSRRGKEMMLIEQKTILPLDTLKEKYDWGAFNNNLNLLNIQQLKTQVDIDSSRMRGMNAKLDIEISTPDKYIYLTWYTPESAPKSIDSEAILEIYNLLCKKIDENNYTWHLYRKNKWNKK